VACCSRRYGGSRYKYSGVCVSSCSRYANAYKAPAAAPAGYDWSGFYIGGHIGGGWTSTTFSDPGAQSVLYTCCFLIGDINNADPTSNQGGSGFIGGAQVGWMYQVGRLVIGADFDWSSVHLSGNGSRTFSSPTGSTLSATEAYTLSTNWTATTTATVGLARDRWLLYTKAGVAWANDSYGLGVTGIGEGFGAATPFSFASSAGQTTIGWTVGVGLKWALTESLFVNVEYDYLDFGSKTQNLSGTFTPSPAASPAMSTAATLNPSFGQSISEVKLGLNYKFVPGFLFW
jgi:outer membrane immunogenic protein